jgi:hypothetical protein
MLYCERCDYVPDSDELQCPKCNRLFDPVDPQFRGWYWRNFLPRDRGRAERKIREDVYAVFTFLIAALLVTLGRC